MSLTFSGFLENYLLAETVNNSALGDISWQGWLTLGVTILTLLGNALTDFPTEIVFLGGAAVLYVTGILDEKATLEGFSNPGMVTVAVLYIVVTGLEQTGGLNGISQKVLGRPKGESSALIRMMTPVIGLSAFLNNTPVVAMFIPVVQDWCRKLGISPSKLMIPLSYAAIFGGICTLIGTSTNLVVNGLLVSYTDHPGFKLLDITWVGLPCAVIGVLFLMFTHRWLLPKRKSVIEIGDDLRKYMVEMTVSPKSSLHRKSIEQAGLRHLPELFLVEIVRGDHVIPAPPPQEVIYENDQLVFVGAVDSIVDLYQIKGLQPATNQVFKLDTPRSQRCLAEAVVSTNCALIGKTIRQGKFRDYYQAVVIAVGRNGKRLKGKIGDIRLRAGDLLLLEAHPSFLARQRISKELYIISGIRNAAPLRHEKAPIAIAILTVMVLLASFGWMSMLKAAVLAAMAMLVTQCCSTIKALRSIEWSVLLVIGSALAIGKALESTGIAGTIASFCVSLTNDNPTVALAVIYGITTVMTEVITNNAAAALIFPVSLSIANDLQVSYLPFVIAIMIAASASFATPIGYQTNLMVYAPGGYKFTDFMRIGIPLNIVFGIVTVIITPLIYPF